MQVARGFIPVSAIDQIVPIRDLIVHGAAGGRAGNAARTMAIGHTAVHAARCLLADFPFRERQDKFMPMLYALCDRLVVAVLTLNFQKPGDLAHTYSAACIVAAFSFAISASARRYSTGITCGNAGDSYPSLVKFP